ncbi:MAG TPA: ABC transporter ATP-binding protein [Flavobacteriales bacterium]|nr:ABC transporter ATP-binding protein [Flavobacteriales bacterium]HIN39473.1 ABC transporter ATP-binding protein [Flavobacteriales bacterium]
MKGQNLLEVKNLVTKFYTEEETINAVNNVSFTLKRGETVGVVGESGSGKSVTSLSVMRLIASPPGEIEGGQILYHNKSGDIIDLLTITEREMRKYRGNEISMIFQEPMSSLNPVYTAGNQVSEAIVLHQKVSSSLAKSITLDLFEKVKLPDPKRIFKAYPHELSGGQKQRVMIAMAMSCDPHILIADEPTTALDVTVQKTILDLMEELQSEHDMGILFITHDLGVIAELADRVVVMYKGKIVEQGDVIDIFMNPQHPYTKGLLACRPPLNKRLYWLPTISDFMETDRSGKMKEGERTINDVVKKFIVSKEERTKTHAELYKKEPLLQIKNLKTWFPVNTGLFGKTSYHIKAVDDVSFDVFPGETLGLVGESGCGKTTLGRSILRLEEPISGEVLYKGQDLMKLSKSELRSLRKEVQIIFQDPYSSLNPRITIGEAIMEPMSVHGIFSNSKERKDRVIEILERVKMDATHFYRYPHEFSGGQRQRICIARAITLNPKLIICDESVSALDVSIQAQVLNLLNELRENYGFTYIFISHDLSVVKFMSDRIIVMKEGKIMEIGDADDVYKNPRTDYTKMLIDAIPKGRIQDIKRAIKLKAERLNIA